MFLKVFWVTLIHSNQKELQEENIPGWDDGEGLVDEVSPLIQPGGAGRCEQESQGW